MKIQDRQKQQREIEKACSKMGKVIGSCMPDGLGFALIFTDFGESGGMAYVSNAEREGMIKVLREAANKIEGTGN